MPVRVVSVERNAGAFQQPLGSDQIEAICEHVFGAGIVESAVELSLGTYNTTYRLDRAGGAAVLRIAPEADRAEPGQGGLRNEDAATPYLAILGDLAPKVIAADFTHELVNRDYLVQSFLPGSPAPEAPVHWDLAPVLALLHR